MENEILILINKISWKEIMKKVLDIIADYFHFLIPLMFIFGNNYNKKNKEEHKDE